MGYSSGERINVPNRCGMGALRVVDVRGEQAEKFFLGSGGLIRLDARCPQVSGVLDGMSPGGELAVVEKPQTPHIPIYNLPLKEQHSQYGWQKWDDDFRKAEQVGAYSQYLCGRSGTTIFGRRSR